MQKLAVRPRFVKRLLVVSALLIVAVSMIGQSLVRATGTQADSEPTWAAPTSMALRRVGATGTSLNQPVLLSNLDCSPITYRLAGQSATQTGCFTPTAFGMLDIGNQVVIFNGTDEGLQLSSPLPHQVLVPWPYALNMLTLDAVNTGGSYLGMYTNPVAQMQDQRDHLGHLTGKRLSTPPDIVFRDHAGQRLVVNAQTLAFSQGGSWLVAETLGGSFVRINLATLDMTAFAPHFGTQSSGGLLQSRVAVSDNGRFVAIENSVADSFKVYDLSTCSGVVMNLRPESCLSYDYRPFIKQRIGGLQAIYQVRFVNNQLMRFEVLSSNRETSGTYTLAPVDNITSMTDYIALGDSYTSGEGAFDYLVGTDTDNNHCHVSAHSYPLLLTRGLFNPASGHSIACSGAVIDDIGSGESGYRGQLKQGASFYELSHDSAKLERIKADFTPGYLAQRRFVRHYQPRIVTVSIGGNDIGFGNLLQRCVMPHVSRHTSDSTCYNTYESRKEVVRLVDRTIPRWIALYKQLRADNPGGQLYAIGYPSIASDTGACGVNVSLGKSELEFAEELLAYLNGAIAQAATAASVPYIDIGRALEGHRLCEATGAAVAVNGLTAGKDSGLLGIAVLGRESYHPNALGHQLIEQAILRQTANLTSRSLTASPESSADNLLDVPKSGRALNRLIPATGIAPAVLRSGSGFVLQVDGVKNSLNPNTGYMVRLNGVSGPLIGTVSSKTNGDIKTVVHLPPNTMPGGHSIDIFGPGQNDEPLNITQPVYISEDDADPDGDRFMGAVDSCPYAINSGQDADNDGTDDICDPLIHASNGPANPAQTSERPVATPVGNPGSNPPSLRSSFLSGSPIASSSATIESRQPAEQQSIIANSRGALSELSNLFTKSTGSTTSSGLLGTATQQPKRYQPVAQPGPRFVVPLAALCVVAGGGFCLLWKWRHEHI